MGKRGEGRAPLGEVDVALVVVYTQHHDWLLPPHLQSRGAFHAIAARPMGLNSSARLQMGRRCLRGRKRGAALPGLAHLDQFVDGADASSRKLGEQNHAFCTVVL